MNLPQELHKPLAMLSSAVGFRVYTEIYHMNALHCCYRLDARPQTKHHLKAQRADPVLATWHHNFMHVKTTGVYFQLLMHVQVCYGNDSTRKTVKKKDKYYNCNIK